MTHSALAVRSYRMLCRYVRRFTANPSVNLSRRQPLAAPLGGGNITLEHAALRPSIDEA